MAFSSSSSYDPPLLSNLPLSPLAVLVSVGELPRPDFSPSSPIPGLNNNSNPATSSTAPFSSISPCSLLSVNSETMLPPVPSPDPVVPFPTVFSPEVVLAVTPQPQAYTPMSAFLGCFGSLQRSRHAHNSSKEIGNYPSISEVMLAKRPINIIDRFRAVIKSMEPSISFPTSIMLPFQYSAMSSKVDVSSYLDVQVVISAWPVVTRRFPPSQRSYDLLSVKQLQTQVCSTTAEARHPGFILNRELRRWVE